jgi:hypothetical protein
MSRFEGPQGIVTNGLVLNLDAGDPDSYTRSQPPYVEVLVVAGGGGGGVGSNGGGGGGAGGLIYNSAFQLTNAAAITVTVGAGGASTIGRGAGNNGSNSVFSSLTATGGGGGGGASGGPASGKNGGSGGGAQYSSFGGSGTAGQGTNGGDGNYYLGGIHDAGGGGGGAGASGLNATATNAGNGGNGSPYSISGVSTYYAGGGGGSSNNQSGPGPFFPGIGGLGGGGNGGINGTTLLGTDGVDGLGAGGGAGVGATGGNSGAGGDGIVIVRYPGLPAATGGTITYLNGYTIHTFTSSGTFTPYPWNDLTGTAYSASLINGPSFNSFQNGGYIAFDGVDDYATTFTTPPSLQGDPNFTVCAWMKRTGDGGGNTGTWGLSGDGNGINSWWFFNNNEITIDTWGQATFTTGTTYPLNEWVFVAWQKIAGDMTRANCILWRNLVSYTGTQLTVLRPEAGPPNIGNNGVNIARISQTYNTPTPIQVGKFWIYNRVLSSTEITQNFNATRDRFGI